VGEIEGGIQDSVLSPDQDIVSILSSDRVLIFMSQSWEPITEIHLPPTKLQGLTKGNISWRGDGKFLCVREITNRMGHTADSRQGYLYVYDRSLKLVHESVDLIQSIDLAFSWQCIFRLLHFTRQA
jgi:hypothetical protein